MIYVYIYIVCVYMIYVYIYFVYVYMIYIYIYCICLYDIYIYIHIVYVYMICIVYVYHRHGGGTRKAAVAVGIHVFPHRPEDERTICGELCTDLAVLYVTVLLVRQLPC